MLELVKSTIFFDLEVNNQNKITDIGAVSAADHVFHGSSINDFFAFIKDAEYLVGHNVIKHDLKYLEPLDSNGILSSKEFIDTLLLSPLLFPKRPYHKLLKDDKLFVEELNNPVNDSKKSRELFYDEVVEFKKLDDQHKIIYFRLLNQCLGIQGFFKYIQFEVQESDYTEIIIKKHFSGLLCENANISVWLKFPLALSYCLALISADDSTSRIAPWILKNFAEAERIYHSLRGTPCLQGCNYCNQSLNPYNTLKKYFGYESFKTFDNINLQENAIRAAINGDSILVVFPTGGGKSLTFQVPALMDGDNENSLTVIISPLVALMKDQVDNLESKYITGAVTINGLLDPITRSNAIERIADGGANLLYIAPESLRSNTIFNLLVNRKIARFVIDEAHCFSSWGHDFRIDYQYIGKFMNELVAVKGLDRMIPVSCFTATAKKNVIADIKSYFKESVKLELKEFTTSSQRKNLHYEIFEEGTEASKFNRLIDLIKDNDPSIVYVSRVKKAQKLAENLTKAGYIACYYHGKLNNEDKQKNQEDFKKGRINIMVATSAFGMGVDKADVKRVIHYDISDSIENYVQEAGRAGRDEKLQAECSILYNESDIDKHLILLNQTKLNKTEIEQIWKGIKKLTRKRMKVSNSALEIARAAGWETSIRDLETRVTTAIAALEKAGYVQRSRNSPRVFANSIQTKTAQEAIDKINSAEAISPALKQDAARIIKKLISQKRKSEASGDDAESRVDYISEHLGIEQHRVIDIINLLKQEQILADHHDISASIDFEKDPSKIIEVFELFRKSEKELLELIDNEKSLFNLKQLSDKIRQTTNIKTSPAILRTIINFWAISSFVETHSLKPNIVEINFIKSVDSLQHEMINRHQDSAAIFRHLLNKVEESKRNEDRDDLVYFSLTELHGVLDPLLADHNKTKDFREIENHLFYLSKIGILKIEDGFIVMYNKLQVERTEENSRKQYTDDDYKELSDYYKNKTEQIHIVAEYAKKLINDYDEALSFVNDYFTLNYSSFISKYFPDATTREALSKPISPKKFREIFETVSPRQAQILTAKEKLISVIAGPGSGKTKVLVHKMAAQLFLENIKSEQLLMLTFSRSAASEFKKRLYDLVGNAAAYVEIKTFHAYCFDLLGRMGSLDNSPKIVQDAVDGIKNGDIEISRITKLSLIIDEAQDISKEEYRLIQLLLEKNENLKLIVVGDDLQNIYAFRGSDSIYLKQFGEMAGSQKFELTENFRSSAKIVAVANSWATNYLTSIRKEVLVAHDLSNKGEVIIINYNSGEFINSLALYLKSTPLSGSTAVFTRTNEETYFVSGFLAKWNIPFRLVNTNDGFNLRELYELRAFHNLLSMVSENAERFSDDTWNDAKDIWKKEFINSPHFDSCYLIINRFEEETPKRKVLSEWIDYVQQSRFEDFLTIHHNLVYVMTLHKAKGKEFDNVFVLHKDGFVLNEEEKRLIYVGITRAKTNLYIHTNTKIYNNLKLADIKFIDGLESTEVNDTKNISLTHKDVQLGYFAFVQHHINNLRSGDQLVIKNGDGYNRNDNRVVRFSDAFMKKLETERQKGFLPTHAIIRFIVYWLTDEGKEVKIILPQITLKREKFTESIDLSNNIT